jgi:hypothetical protein
MTNKLFFCFSPHVTTSVYGVRYKQFIIERYPMKDNAQPVNSEVYTTEASESKARAEAEAKAPDPPDAKERFEKLLAAVPPKEE